jgi:hypothetical protein
MTIHIEPTNEYPIPYVETADEPSSFLEALQTTVNTHEAIEQLGMVPEVPAEDVQKTKELIEKALTKQDTKTLSNPMVAFGAKEFLRVYSARLAVDVSDVRSALTNKLLELANCGDPRFELKALELLGKHSDIALFTERSEVTVNYKTSEDLESAIKERIKRLLKSNVVDVDAKSYAPNTSQALEMELGPVKDRTQNDSSAED